MGLLYLAFICIVIVTTISGLIVAVRMRRRMKKSLGRRASSLDLVSFRSWNEVEELERRKEESKAIHPE
jgi:hypothetical protein